MNNIVINVIKKSKFSFVIYIYFVVQISLYPIGHNGPFDLDARDLSLLGVN